MYRLKVISTEKQFIREWVKLPHSQAVTLGTDKS